MRSISIIKLQQSIRQFLCSHLLFIIISYPKVSLNQFIGKSEVYLQFIADKSFLEKGSDLKL